MPVALSLVLVLFFLLMNAFFVVAEFSLVRVRKSQVDILLDEGRSGAKYAKTVADNVNAYLAIYCVILVLSFAVISVDGFSIGTNFSAVASCFNNIGPGFELVGATQNFSIYSDLSKIILSLDMLLGRLEIFPLLLLLSPDTWSRRR